MVAVGTADTELANGVAPFDLEAPVVCVIGIASQIVGHVFVLPDE